MQSAPNVVQDIITAIIPSAVSGIIAELVAFAIIRHIEKKLVSPSVPPPRTARCGWKRIGVIVALFIFLVVLGYLYIPPLLTHPENLVRKEAALFVAQDVNNLLRLYASDAEIIPSPGAQPWTGKRGISDYYQSKLSSEHYYYLQHRVEDTNRATSRVAIIHTSTQFLMRRLSSASLLMLNFDEHPWGERWICVWGWGGWRIRRLELGGDYKPPVS